MNGRWLPRLLRRPTPLAELARRVHARAARSTESHLDPPTPAPLVCPLWVGAIVARLWATYERLYAERGLPAKPFIPGDEQGIRTRLGLRWTVEQIELSLHAVIAREAEHPGERVWADGNGAGGRRCSARRRRST